MELKMQPHNQRFQLIPQKALLGHALATVVAAALFGYPAASLAGPFGYDQGMTRETVKKISKDVRETKGALTVKQPPLANENIQSLTLFFSKKSGLCSIITTGKLFPAYSTEHEFAETVRVLSEKYGKPHIGFEPNRDVHQAIRPEDWYRAVMEEKGTLLALWAEEGQRRLPDSLRTVRLSVTVVDIGKGAMGTLLFVYAFSNHEECLSESRGDRSKGL